MTKLRGIGGFHVVLVGCGRMGTALVGGAIRQGVVAPSDVEPRDSDDSRRLTFCEATGCDPNFRASSPRIFVLAVKPDDAAAALRSAGATEADVVLSVAAGVSVASLQSASPAQVVRSMPNTPALVGAGITGVYFGGDEVSAVSDLLDAVGEVVVLSKESDFDAVTALGGSGPAFVFTMLEALADGGVRAGLTREVAQAFALQTVLGSAELALSEGVHSAELKDRVASPGGTTIAGLAVLESRGFRSALIDAVFAAAERSREIAEKNSADG